MAVERASRQLRTWAAMRSFESRVIVATAALLVALLTVHSAFAQTPTPTTTPAAAPTPDASTVPAMPAGATLQNDSTICWTDSSDNETGFEIGVGFCERSFTFTVGANVTCFELPPEARRSAFPDDCVGAYQFWVSAFNDAGKSFPQVISMPVRKGEPPTPTPSAPTVLPGTGETPNGHDSSVNAALLAVAPLLVLFSAAAIIISRQARPSDRLG